MRKFTKLTNGFLIIFFIAFFASCTKDKVKTIEIDSKWDISLFHDTITVNDMLDNADSLWNNWLSYDEAGNLYSVFYDSLERIMEGKDFLWNLNDQHFSSHNEIPVVIPPIPNFHVSLPPFDLLSDSLAFDNMSITEAEIYEASINISLTTNIDIIDTLILTTDEIKMKDGNSLSDTLFFYNSTAISHVNLNGCKIQLKEDKKIKFQGQISLTSNGNAYDNITMDVNISIVDLNFHSIKGNVNFFTPFHGIEPADFGITSVSGDLLIYTPSVFVKYINTFEFDNTIVIDTLGFYDIDDQFITLLKNDSVCVDMEYCENYTEIPVNGIVETIDIINDYKLFEYGGSITLSGNERQINDDSYISFIVNSEIPLKFKTDDLMYIDTIGINISDVDNIKDEDVDELKFKFIFGNTLQCKIIPQIYLSQNGIVVDSLFVDDDCIAGCYEGNLKESIINIPIDTDKINDVINSDQLILKFQLDTEDNILVFNTNQYFDLRIGLELKSSSINLDDLN